MKFFVIEDGELVMKTWCDNPSCVFYQGRKGITLGIKILEVDEMHFCSERCMNKVLIKEHLTLH